MPRHFLPKQSGAHRVACIALYKALLLQCTRIQLPAEGFHGQINSIKHQIRKQFRFNQHDTSPRLVVAALKLGYEAEELLRTAGDGDITARSRVLDLLGDIHAQGDAERIRLASIPKPSRTPYLGATRYAGAPPALESRPRPLSELSGRRQVPKLVSANNIPILRFKKPQSPFLSRIIDNKIKQRQSRIDNIDKTETLVAWGRDEDEWDHIVGSKSKKKEDLWHTESHVQKKSIEGLMRNEERKVSQISKRMLEIVDKEQALADQEREDRKAQKSKERRKRKEARGVTRPGGSGESHD